MQKVFLPERVFTGDQWLTDHAIVIENGLITEVRPFSEINSSNNSTHLKGFAAPAFIDLQIYGAAQKLFAVHPSTEALQLLNDYCRNGGAVLFQPTVATNALPVFYRCIDAVKEYWREGGEGCIGLHLEGPWINKLKKGAHPEEFIHSPSLQEVKDLLAYGKGVITMITLAPEVCSEEIIELIRENNIAISAGHSNATYNEAMQALDKGIPTITHLYNAMSPLQHREPGLVGAAFRHATAKASIIPDGHHVDFAAIGIAKEMMKDRLYVITDAVTETFEGVYRHKPDGDKYVSNGILSGSALTMHKAFMNLVKNVGIPVEEAIRMCSLYPAQVMQIETKYGKIAPGYTAQFLVLDQEYDLLKTING
jgi:N-acetylglucosamine-6-phosphate deacetylase